MKEKKYTVDPFAASIIAEIKNDEVLLACKNYGELQNHCFANTLSCLEYPLKAEGLERTHQLLNAAQNDVNLWLVARTVECRPNWNSVDMDLESHSAGFLIKHAKEANWETEESVCDELWFDDIYLKIRSFVKENTGK